MTGDKVLARRMSQRCLPQKGRGAVERNSKFVGNCWDSRERREKRENVEETKGSKAVFRGGGEVT